MNTMYSPRLRAIAVLRAEDRPARMLVGHDLDLIGKPRPELALQRLVVIDHHDHLARSEGPGQDRFHAVDSLLEPVGRERAHDHGGLRTGCRRLDSAGRLRLGGVGCWYLSPSLCPVADS